MAKLHTIINPILCFYQVALKALPSVLPSIDSLKADESGVSELLNLAWGEHEITDEYLPETLKWFFDHAS